MTTPGQNAPDGAFVVGSRFGQDITEESAKVMMKGGVVSSFENAQGVAHSTYNNVIDDHSQQLVDLTEAVEKLVLQGSALVFYDNDTYTPSPGIVAVDVILIGAGGGGSSGSYDIFVHGTRSGGGGGGGGETHTSIPASLLPVNADGSYKPIQIIIGAGGAGASVDSNFGAGGGHTHFGPQVGVAGQSWLLGGGGQGGMWGNNGPVALGGVGMVPGGDGASGLGRDSPATGPGTSSSPFDLHGGGGGGGRGAATAYGAATPGGGGGISPGGAPGVPGAPGKSPSEIVATGGGGGGGGASGNAGGGPGGYPGGGGGGSACSGVGATFGGKGADGVLYVIERGI
ncbi:hypothetical protein [Nocardia sp. CNY236]|uniref:hypothetical protein n=1 Tax=Nocardia sp. CNY236 TaxID=1169152 RepID=UPI00048F53B1|nr:hypothetical protein [Nocardia sp. CNY236]